MQTPFFRMSIGLHDGFSMVNSMIQYIKSNGDKNIMNQMYKKMKLRTIQQMYTIFATSKVIALGTTNAVTACAIAEYIKSQID